MRESDHFTQVTSVPVTVVLRDNANSGVGKLRKDPEWFVISSVNSGRSELSLDKASSGLPCIAVIHLLR